MTCAYCGREYGEMGDSDGSYVYDRPWCGTCDKLPAVTPEALLERMLKLLSHAREDYWNRPGEWTESFGMSKHDWTVGVQRHAFLEVESILSATYKMYNRWNEEQS